MKISKEHYNYIKDKFSTVDPELVKAHRHNVGLEPKCYDIDKRVRWDTLYSVIKSDWVCDYLYPYLDDSHIDTALKSIVKELKI
jgi:hypothetical protein